jgi:hypothetical protein
MLDLHSGVSDTVIVSTWADNNEPAHSSDDRLPSPPPEDRVGWGEYALFVLRQQGGYCQLV